MNEAELAKIGAQAQIDLHLENWRVVYVFEKDLCSGEDPVYALCFREKDSKRALIKVRDPSTPPPGMTPEQWAVAIRTAVYHEVDHLHFAPFETLSPAEITAEENAVWGTTFALESAWNVPADCRLATIGIKRRSAMPDNEKDNEGRAAEAGGEDQVLLDIIANNDEKGALEWVKGYVKRKLSGPDSEPAPAAQDPNMADAGNMDQPQNGPQAARAARRPSAYDAEMSAIARSGRTSALRLAISTARTVDGVTISPAAEKLILSAKTFDEGEKLLSVARLATAGAQRPAGSGAEQKGKDQDTAKDEDTEGLASHEIAAYRSLKKSDPKAATQYLADAKKINARKARTAPKGQ